MTAVETRDTLECSLFGTIPGNPGIPFCRTPSYPESRSGRRDETGPTSMRSQASHFSKRLIKTRLHSCRCCSKPNQRQKVFLEVWQPEPERSDETAKRFTVIEVLLSYLSLSIRILA
eukprot:scaffold20719_cov94-Skeletonema_dohrnii-CCMP3373.AAC.2